MECQKTLEILKGWGQCRSMEGQLYGEAISLSPVWALCAGKGPGLKGILQGPVPELIVLSHLLLPFLSFCHFHLELSQLSGQFLLVLSIEVLQLLPKRTQVRQEN